MITLPWGMVGNPDVTDLLLGRPAFFDRDHKRKDSVRALDITSVTVSLTDEMLMLININQRSFLQGIIKEYGAKVIGGMKYRQRFLHQESVLVDTLFLIAQHVIKGNSFRIGFCANLFFSRFFKFFFLLSGPGEFAFQFPDSWNVRKMW